MARALDGYERVFWHLGLAAGANVVAVAGLRGPAGKAPWQEVLAKVQQRHALLRVGVAEGPGVPSFVPASGPLPVTVHDLSEEGWVAAAEAELAAPFPLEGPLLRASVLLGEGHAELVLAFHHVIGDALGAFELCREVVSTLAGRPVPAADPPFPEALGNLAPKVPPSTDRLQGLRFLARALGPKPTALTWETEAPPASRRSALAPRSLGPPESSDLAARAKREGTTVHGALVAALLLAVRARHPAGGRRRMACVSAINLRPHLADPPADAFGLYAVGPPPVATKVARDEDFWDLARRARAGVASYVEAGHPFGVLRALQRVPSSSSQAPRFVVQLDRYTRGRVAVTNLGRLEAEDAAPWSWETFHFAPAVPVGSDVTLAATTFRGTLALNVVHPVPLVSRATASALADDLVQRLRAAT